MQLGSRWSSLDRQRIRVVQARGRVRMGGEVS